MRPTGGHTWSGQPRAPLSTCAVYRFHFVSRSHIHATGGLNVFIGKKWHCPLKADKPLISWLLFFVVSPDEMSCGVMWRSDLGPAVQPKHYQRKHMAALRPVGTGLSSLHCCIVGRKENHAVSIIEAEVLNRQEKTTLTLHTKFCWRWDKEWKRKEKRKP